MKNTPSLPKDRLDKFVQLPDDHRAKMATPSYSSPRNSKRACLCDKTNTYSRKCCNGDIRAQGIGFIN